MWYPLWSNGDELLCIVDVQNDDHDGWAQEFQVVQSSPTFRGFARRDISRQNHSQPWKMVATTTLVTEAEKPFNIPQIAYFEEEATMFENHKKSLRFNIASEASYVYILSGQKFK